MEIDVTKKEVADAVKILQDFIKKISTDKDSGIIAIYNTSTIDFVNRKNKQYFSEINPNQFVNNFETKLGIEFKAPQG